MTRKDYVRAAQIISTAPIATIDKSLMAEQFADMFAADNSRFDRARFMEAALGKDEA